MTFFLGRSLGFITDRLLPCSKGSPKTKQNDVNNFSRRPCSKLIAPPSVMTTLFQKSSNQLSTPVSIHWRHLVAIQKGALDYIILSLKPELASFPGKLDANYALW